VLYSLVSGGQLVSVNSTTSVLVSIAYANRHLDPQSSIQMYNILQLYGFISLYSNSCSLDLFVLSQIGLGLDCL